MIFAQLREVRRLDIEEGPPSYSILTVIIPSIPQKEHIHINHMSLYPRIWVQGIKTIMPRVIKIARMHTSKLCLVHGQRAKNMVIDPLAFALRRWFVDIPLSLAH